jgi:hypothetical protein
VELVAIIVSSSGIFRMNQGGQYSDLPVARVNCHFSNQPSWGAVFTNSLQLVGHPDSGPDRYREVILRQLTFRVARHSTAMK